MALNPDIVPMIIVEGPDGAGKTTFIRHLSGLLVGQGYVPELAPRFATSEGGPIGSLGDAVMEDWVKSVRYSDTPADLVRIYDRHPMVSEYVYGPVLRGGVDDSVVRLPSGLQEAIHEHAYVIAIMPPLEVCKERLAAEPQLEGVVDNYEDIYAEYANSFLDGNSPFKNFSTYDGVSARSLHGVLMNLLNYLDGND